MKNVVLLAVLFVVVWTSCSPGFFFQDEKEIKGGQWSYRDTVDFSFVIQDTSVLYNLYVDITHADTFPNQNIYVKLYTKFPDGKRLSKTCSFDFFDAQGHLNGTSSGHSCRLHALLQANAFFKDPGTYAITLEQFMRRDPVGGVNKVGLSVEKTAAKRAGKQ
jgi:gliding motility-associated lipoprotein GldH